MNSLKGKVIIVTGGNGLLGKSIVDCIKLRGGICVNLDLYERIRA